MYVIDLFECFVYGDVSTIVKEQNGAVCFAVACTMKVPNVTEVYLQAMLFELGLSPSISCIFLSTTDMLNLYHMMIPIKY